MDDGATEVERTLRRRATATKASLAGLLQQLDAERQRTEARLADSLPAEAADELRKLQSGALVAVEQSFAAQCSAQSAVR